jgi:hypothetical protein
MRQVPCQSQWSDGLYHVSAISLILCSFSRCQEMPCLVFFDSRKSKESEKGKYRSVKLSPFFSFIFGVLGNFLPVISGQAMASFRMTYTGNYTLPNQNLSFYIVYRSWLVFTVNNNKKIIIQLFHSSKNSPLAFYPGAMLDNIKKNIKKTHRRMWHCLERKIVKEVALFRCYLLYTSIDLADWLWWSLITVNRWCSM